MLIIGLILSIFAIGLFCWLIFVLAVYALLFFVGLTTGMAAFHGGAGILGAFVIGIVVGALTLSIGQIAFALVKPSPLRLAIAAAFAVPAAVAGYHAVFGLSEIVVPSLFWRETFAWAGAIMIGCAVWARVMVAGPLPLPEPRKAGHSRSQPQRVNAVHDEGRQRAATHRSHPPQYYES